MKEFDPKKTNKSADNIWQLIQVALKERNMQVLELNLKRLFTLQKYYCELLNNQSHELKILRYEERYLNSVIKDYEKKEFEQLCKDNGTYQALKSQIDEIFK